MRGMLTGICIIILVVCVCVMGYSIINAILTSKRNKATDEATRQIFLAKIKQSQDAKFAETHPEMSQAIKENKIDFEPDRPKAINYDEYVDLTPSEDDATIEGKSLKDFFG